MVHQPSWDPKYVHFIVVIVAGAFTVVVSKLFIMSTIEAWPMLKFSLSLDCSSSATVSDGLEFLTP